MQPGEMEKAKAWLSSFTGPMEPMRAHWPGLAELLHSHAEEAVKAKDAEWRVALIGTDHLGMTPDQIREQIQSDERVAVEEAVKARDEWWHSIFGAPEDIAHAPVAVRDWAVKARDQELTQLRLAVGLLTTLAPKMEMRSDDPLGMAQEIVEVVKAATEELRAARDRACAALSEAYRVLGKARQAREKAEEAATALSLKLGEAERARDVYKTAAREYMEKRDAALAEPSVLRSDHHAFGVSECESCAAVRKRVEELEALHMNAESELAATAAGYDEAAKECVRLAESVEQARRAGAEEMRERALAAARSAIHLHDEHYPGHHGGVFPTCLYPSLNDIDAAIRALPIDPPKALEPINCPFCQRGDCPIDHTRGLPISGASTPGIP